MSRLHFTEPRADGHSAIDVYVTNSDDVSVSLSDPQTDDTPTFLSYWQLERITKKVRSAFAFQLDREEAERAPHPEGMP